MAYNRRKRKAKRDITEGQAHIHSTFNNTIATTGFAIITPRFLIIINHKMTRLFSEKNWPEEINGPAMLKHSAINLSLDLSIRPRQDRPS